MSEHLEQEYSAKSTEEIMREVRDEWMPKDLRDDAEEVLHVVLDMTPRQRRDALENLREAQAFINRAVKECE